ncbi:hypothetical protein POSPLADRAFT_1046623 [Postia placenta MAD-698-R-SB12]|uniref:Uncharacterized protein n=1 Tax=Postia placenta MAD-698-R-SB12 TaxID=670580 RepID=A0A1X6N0U5_9APHY|nr:hypothetical protein POSPLADRAFT_1046623 [Postia placenta MAD-698-R-SB12]OSX62251.1 hypothetical protein POSPLADRAFT_1046623 [Postia placenta MAD-698-R-SB12]
MSTNTSRSPATDEPIAGPSTTPTSSSPRPSAAGESGKSHASPSRVAGASNTPTRSNATFPHHITGTFNVPNATESDDVFDEPIVPAPPARRGTKRRRTDGAGLSTSGAPSSKRTKKGKGRAAASSRNTLRDGVDENIADGTPSSDEGVAALPDTDRRPILVVEESEPQVPYQCGVPGCTMKIGLGREAPSTHLEKHHAHLSRVRCPWPSCAEMSAEVSAGQLSRHILAAHGPLTIWRCPRCRMKFQWYYRKDTVGRHAEKCKGAKEGSQSTIFGQPLPRPGSVATPATPEPSSSAGVSSERPPSAGPLTVSTVSSPLPSQSVTDAEQGTSDSLRIIATSPRLTGVSLRVSDNLPTSGIPAVAESAEVIIEASVTTSAMSTPSTPSPGRQSAGPQQRVSPQHSPRLPAVDMLGTASPSPGTVNIADDRTLLEADTQASTAVETMRQFLRKRTCSPHGWYRKRWVIRLVVGSTISFYLPKDITEWMITEGIASHYHRIYERHKRMPDVPGGSLEQGPSPAFDKELVVLCHLGALSSTRIHEADTCRLINIDRLIVVIYHFYLKWWLDVCMELIVIMYTNVAIPPTEM